MGTVPICVSTKMGLSPLTQDAMRYKNVCLEAIAHTLPEEVVTSAEIEARLAPLYTRLRLPEGRLELMTGIRERRFWLPDVPPSEKSVEAASKALDRTGIDRQEIGALVHGSVCRDFMEPATACGVHHGLGLPNRCAVYDVSNACLGILNGVVQVANMIELGLGPAPVARGQYAGAFLTTVRTSLAAVRKDEVEKIRLAARLAAGGIGGPAEHHAQVHGTSSTAGSRHGRRRGFLRPAGLRDSASRGCTSIREHLHEGDLYFFLGYQQNEDAMAAAANALGVRTIFITSRGPGPELAVESASRVRRSPLARDRWLPGLAGLRRESLLPLSAIMNLTCYYAICNKALRSLKRGLAYGAI